MTNPVKAWFDYSVWLNRHADADQAIQRTFALDPHHPRTHVILSVIRQLGTATRPAVALRRALDLSPLNAGAHHEMAIVLMRLGRFQEALAAERPALYLAPASRHIQAGMGEII